MSMYFLLVIPFIFILAGGGENSPKLNGGLTNRRIELMAWNLNHRKNQLP